MWWLLFRLSVTASTSILIKKLIELPLVRKILRWRHTGFNVHSKVRTQTKSEAERIGMYMIRPVLSLKRLSFDENEGKVRYQHSRHNSQEELMDYLEFIARVTSHIPDKGQVMVRYYGLYSNAHRGKMWKAGADPSHPPVIEGDPIYKGWGRLGWVGMIRKVYEVDLLLCPSCGGRIRILPFIEEPKTIDRIIYHPDPTYPC